MVADRGELFWTCGSCGTVVKKSLSGGSSTTLASGQNNPISIAVDATHVYYGTNDALKRAAR